MTGNPLEQSGAAGRSSTGAKQVGWWADLARLDPVLSPSLVAAILAAGDGPPLPPTPQPSPPIPVAATQDITYLFTNLAGDPLAELPLTGVSFSYVLNGGGQFQANLSVEDPQIGDTDVWAATSPNLTWVWVDINGTLVWGGLVQSQTYTKTQQALSLTAVDPIAYLAQRVQDVDYATTWDSSPAGAMEMVEQILTDCLTAANSLPNLALVTEGTTPSSEQVYFQAPLSQRWTVDMLTSRLSQLGYLTGFDFAVDYSYSGGKPLATITLSYPRRGRIAGETGLLIDEGNSTEFVYTLDGQQQAMSTRVLLNATGTGGESSGTWVTAMTVDGYPLLERVSYQSMVTKVADPTTIINGLISNDLMLYAYPTATAKVTVPLFDEPSIGEWIVGDDVELVVPVGSAIPANPRFPDGLNEYMRISEVDVTVSDEGESTAEFTLVMPPSTTPQRPPL